jgi:hypothetical protein
LTFFAGISVAEFVPLEKAKEIIDGRTTLTDPRIPVHTDKSNDTGLAAVSRRAAYEGRR